MDAAVAIHTAARRYCLERYALWTERYAELTRRGGDRKRDGYHYTPEALDTFPRYNVLNAIRVEVERADPGALGDLEAARAWLIRAGRTGEDDFTREPIGDIDRRAMDEEREAFCRHIAGLSVPDLAAVEPLPFRRVMADDEANALRSRLFARWQITQHYWYPLSDCSLPGLVAFRADAFHETVSPDQLQGVLRRRGVERVWELREYGPEYEQDGSLFDPFYNGPEGHWSSGALDWIVYASHENSITVGGWLVEEVKALWPAWQEHLWTGPF